MYSTLRACVHERIASAANKRKGLFREVGVLRGMRMNLVFLETKVCHQLVFFVCDLKPKVCDA